MMGVLSDTEVGSWVAALCRNEEEDCCLPKASGQEVSFEDGSFGFERPELPSFQGLAGQCFSGVDGMAVLSSVAFFDSKALGASRVEECS
jgi:hypothetical protein